MRLAIAVALLASVPSPQTLTAAPPTAGCATIDLDQNWDRATKEKFWFTSQGSRIMPYAWFVALEVPWGETLFKDPSVIDRLLGYISIGPSDANRDALPIGFAKDTDKSGATYIGLTCAACHTARIEFEGTTRLVEGGPAMADFATFLNWLVDALQRTSDDSAKFNRFAQRVLGTSATAGAKADLHSQLKAETQSLEARRSRNHHNEPYGYARVDAFGHILNEVMSKDLGIPANAREPNAPVSYPFLWDTPQHDRVQWNGVAPNTEFRGLGALFRNIGEVLGVFGRMELTPRNGLPPIYSSSIQKENLRILEQTLESLWSPKWPAACAPLDPALVNSGAGIFKRDCESCHNDINRTDPNRKVKAQMTSVSDSNLDTDQTMALNFARRVGETGRLKGTPKRIPIFWFFGNFGVEASGADVLGNAVFGVYLGKALEPGGPMPNMEDSLKGGVFKQIETVLDALHDKSLRYKGRPLNGIWATAPYLHNGSVPNLRQLLTEPEKRDKQFFVGSRKIDVANVGLSTAQEPNAFRFDATRPGNLNTGHKYGTKLSDQEKNALLEYLKSL